MAENEAPRPKPEPRIHIREVEVALRSFASILPPVFFTMLLSAFIVLYITPDADENIQQSPIVAFNEENAGSNQEATGLGILNALIIVGAITLMTFIIVLVIHFRWEKCFKAYIVIALILLMGFTTGTMVVEGLRFYEIPTDIYSLGIFFFNYAIVGSLAIFSFEFEFQGEERLIPYILTQTYLVLISVVMAWLVTTIFPDFTVWALLVCLALYDLCAVLTPCGPLKLLLQVVTKRQEEEEQARADRGDNNNQRPQKQMLPGLLYETGTGKSKGMKKFRSKKKPEADAGAATALNFSVVLALAALEDGDKDKEDDNVDFEDEEEPQEQNEADNDDHAIKDLDAEAEEREQVPEQEQDTGVEEVDVEQERLEKARRRALQKAREEHAHFMEMLEESNLKLGLGDFVFYSVLTAQAAEFGFTAFVSVATVVLCGLCGTLVLLSVFQQALPALPISIVLGVITYIVVFQFVSPFTDGLALSLASI